MMAGSDIVGCSICRRPIHRNRSGLCDRCLNRHDEKDEAGWLDY